MQVFCVYSPLMNEKLQLEIEAMVKITSEKVDVCVFTLFIFVQYSHIFLLDIFTFCGNFVKLLA